MTVSVDRHNLTFDYDYPSEDDGRKEVVISNPSQTNTIAFKVKTTIPAEYCVRPNNAYLTPGQSVSVEFISQFNQPKELEKKHKFLIQSTTVSAELEPKAEQAAIARITKEATKAGRDAAIPEKIDLLPVDYVVAAEKITGELKRSMGPYEDAFKEAKKNLAAAEDRIRRTEEEMRTARKMLQQSQDDDEIDRLKKSITDYKISLDRYRQVAADCEEEKKKNKAAMEPTEERIKQTLPGTGISVFWNHGPSERVPPQPSTNPDLSKQQQQPDFNTPARDNKLRNSVYGTPHGKPVGVRESSSTRSAPFAEEAGEALSTSDLSSQAVTSGSQQGQGQSTSDGQLRQRKTDTSERSTAGLAGKNLATEAAVKARSQNDGVSIKAVAILCLLSFLVAYFVF